MSLCEHSVDGDHSVSPEFLLNSTNTANMTSADCLMENADEVVLSAPTDSEHDNQPELPNKKRKRKKRSTSISRHRNGGDRKRSSLKTINVPVSENREPTIDPAAAAAPAAPAPAPACTSSKIPSKMKTTNEHRKERKSLQDKLHYERRKNARAQEEVQQLIESVNTLQAEKDSKYQQRVQELDVQVASLEADNQNLIYLNEKAQEKVSKLHDSMTKVTDVLDRRTERWTAAREKYNAEIRRVKQGASRRLAVLQKNYEAKLRSSQSLLYKSERQLGKAIVNLESQLDVVQRNAQNATAAALEDVDTTTKEKDAAIATQDCLIHDAVKRARMEEREHFGKVITRHKNKARELSYKAFLFQDRATAAELNAKTAARQAYQSTQQSKNIMSLTMIQKKEIEALQQLLSKQNNDIMDLEHKLEEAEQKQSTAEDSIPIKVFGKIRKAKGGTSSWPSYVWEIIIEQLINGTPPSSVNANIMTMIKTFSPSTVIQELPSIWTIRRARTVLLVIVQTLAAYRIAKADKWKQLFTDGTSRRQISFQNLIISIEEDELFIPLLISSSIFPENDKAETVCMSILDALKEKASLLDQWIIVHESMYGPNHDIPSAESIHLSKMRDGIVTTDTCNTARALSELISFEIEEAIKQKIVDTGGDPDYEEINVYRQDCHNHMRNVWIKHVTIRLSSYLNDLLATDLENIHFRYRVSTMFDAVLRAVDKEFSLPANYPKGHGDMFLHWLRVNHPGALLVPVQRTLLQ